jgi:hypothetical protein
LKINSNFLKIRFTLPTSVAGFRTSDFRPWTVLLLLTFNFILSTSCSAQKNPKKPRVKVITAPSTTLIYDDINYISAIKSVAFYNDKKEGSFPLITLGAQEKLRLDFDDLRPGSHSLYYSVVHCDVNWQPSLLSPIEYLESFGEDRINDYRLSFNTFQTYTHYRLELPNFSVIPKVSGNYLLKVYEDGDASKLLLTRRFYILNQKVNLQAEITRSNLVQQREEYQKINFSVFHPSLNIQNPYLEVKAIVMQNGRSDKTQITEKPLFIRNNQLIYSDDRTNDFKAGNEFRRFDTRSFRYKSDGVAQITKDSLYEVLLFPNGSLNTKSYSYQFDEDGNFFIINQDGTTNDYDADYGNIHFSLRAPAPDANGFAYVVGRFNAYQLNSQNRMTYDAQNKQFSLDMPLKQGVYDYHYVWGTDDGKILDDQIFDGSFYQTENNYQILIYYRAPGARYDEIIAFAQLNTATNPRNY